MRSVYSSTSTFSQHYESARSCRQLWISQLQRAHSGQTLRTNPSTSRTDLPAPNPIDDSTTHSNSCQRFTTQKQSSHQYLAVPFPREIVSQRANHFATPGLRYIRSLRHATTCSSPKMSVFPNTQLLSFWFHPVLPSCELRTSVPPEHRIPDSTYSQRRLSRSTIMSCCHSSECNERTKWQCIMFAL